MSLVKVTRTTSLDCYKAWTPSLRLNFSNDLFNGATPLAPYLFSPLEQASHPCSPYAPPGQDRVPKTS